MTVFLGCSENHRVEDNSMSEADVNPSVRKFILPYKAKVCKGCGQIAQGKELGTNKDVCLVCDSRDFEEIIVTKDTKVHCVYCKRETTVEEVLKQWIDIPFFDVRTLTYYDGCKGWD